MPKASCQRASVLLYLGKAGYDIKLVDSDGFPRGMSQVKLSIPNPSGSTAVDLFDGPIADLIRLFCIMLLYQYLLHYGFLLHVDGVLD